MQYFWIENNDMENFIVLCVIGFYSKSGLALWINAMGDRAGK